jgi:dynein heavy chain
VADLPAPPLADSCQARDNVKFLSTLERHFKAISSGALSAVADGLLPLMNALRMVWIMSRYYG